MADEENPLGGGPFGQGPFGPLIPTVAAAAAAFSMVAVTTATPVTRTLFYQAKVEPPPFIPPPPTEAATFSVVTSGVRTKTLHYQAKVEPLRPPPTVAVAVTLDWLQPFSAAVPRKPVVATLHTPFVPPVAPQVTADRWLQPFKRQVAGPYPVHTQPVLGFAAAPQPTPDEWLQPFQRAVAPPAVRHTQPIYGYQPEVVVSNLTTTLEWLQPFQKAVSPPHPALSQPVSGYQPEAVVVSNLTTTLEWMQPWQKAVPAPATRHTQPAFGYPYLGPNLTTTLEWQASWQGSKPTRPIHTQPVLGTPPEPPVTPDKWQIAWQGARPSKPVHTQPVLGSPYFLPNLTSTLDWQIAWQGPKPTKPIHTQPVFGYPYFAGPNLTTTLEWQIAWQKAVPAPKPVVTQPFYGYPYVATPPAPNLTTTLEWLQRWQGPPRYWPIKVQQTPFIPKEFVQDRIGPDRWLLGFQKAVPARRPIHTQPFYGRSDAAPPTLTWLRGFDRAATARPVRHTQPAFVYSPPAVVTLTTTLEWQQPLSAVLQRQTPRPTQPVFGYPYEAAAAEALEGGSFSVTTAFPLQRSLFYQAKIQPVYPYEQAVEVCIPAFQVLGGFQFNAFQTCADEQPPVEAPEISGVFSVTTPFSFTKTLFYQAWAAGFEPPPPPPVPPEPPPPPLSKFSHGQIFSAGAQTGVGVVYPIACVPAFQAGYQTDAFQICHGQGTPPTRRLRTTRAMTSTRWKRSRGGIRGRGKSRTTTRDDP